MHTGNEGFPIPVPIGFERFLPIVEEVLMPHLFMYYEQFSPALTPVNWQDGNPVPLIWNNRDSLENALLGIVDDEIRDAKIFEAPQRKWGVNVYLLGTIVFWHIDFRDGRLKIEFQMLTPPQILSLSQVADEREGPYIA